MLEILVVWVLAKRIGSIVERKGHKAGLYKTLAILLWFVGEIVGALIGVVLFENRLLVYIVALIGAGVGAITAYLIAKAVPAKDEKKPFPTSPAPFILFGIIGFGLGLVVARVGWAYLSVTLDLYRSHSILLVFNYRIRDVISYMLAGSAGGGMLALSLERKKIPLWALAGLVGGIVGHLVTLPVCCVLKPNPIALFLGSIFGDDNINIRLMVMSGLTNMLVGFFVGGALGLAQKKQKWILPLALSGMAGFGVYGLFSQFVLKWHSDLLVASKNDPSLSLLLTRTTWLKEVLLGVIGGVIIGVCLGWTLRKLNMPLQQFSPQSAKPTQYSSLNSCQFCGKKLLAGKGIVVTGFEDVSRAAQQMLARRCDCVICGAVFCLECGNAEGYKRGTGATHCPKCGTKVPTEQLI